MSQRNLLSGTNAITRHSTETFYNKTITDESNTIAADHLRFGRNVCALPKMDIGTTAYLTSVKGTLAWTSPSNCSVTTSASAPTFTKRNLVYVAATSKNAEQNGSFEAPFLTITDAAKSITDATADNRYTVLVEPGKYNETVELPRYVGLTCVEQGITINSVTVADADIIGAQLMNAYVTNVSNQTTFDNCAIENLICNGSSVVIIRTYVNVANIHDAKLIVRHSNITDLDTTNTSVDVGYSEIPLITLKDSPEVSFLFSNIGALNSNVAPNSVMSIIKETNVNNEKINEADSIGFTSGEIHWGEEGMNGTIATALDELSRRVAALESLTSVLK